jgi:3-methyladenine DNA glycosylase AlkD
MDKIEEAFVEIRKFCEQNANPETEKKYSRYFTEGYDAYGLDQKTSESQRDKWLEQWRGEFTLDDFLRLGDKLIATGKYEEASMAIAFISSQKEHFTAETFDRLGSWLENYIINWAHTDILSGRVLFHFITDNIIKLESLKGWTKSPSKWKRRSIPVTLIDILKTDVSLERLLNTIEPLMLDSDKFVQKGLGWFLREAWKIYKKETEDFLLEWKDTCGRIIIQYATEKMDKDEKSRFKRSKKKTGLE